MTRPKFTIRTLLWLMIVVAAFFAGRAAMMSTIRSQQEQIEMLRRSQNQRDWLSAIETEMRQPLIRDPVR